MESLILFLKGFIIGLRKIIPGVSGSVLAVLLGVYEKTLNNIANLKNSWKNSLKFLGPLGCGIILAIILFSRVLLYFISNYSLATMSFFFGILLATIPKIFKEKVCPMPKDWLLIRND